MSVASTVVRVRPIAWRMLALGALSQAGAAFLTSTPVFLIPELHAGHGLSLATAGTIGMAPTLGMVLTLVLWGAAADRFGERGVITAGLGLSGVFSLAAAAAHPILGFGALLLLVGAASAATNSASGRVVMGWFPRERRGMAMGVRQMSLPIGNAAAALAVPRLVAHVGIGGVMLVVALVVLILAIVCGIGLTNPPRSAAAEEKSTPNPYRGDRFLLRIHTVAVLLVIPQFALSTFGLVWLTFGIGMSTAAAGTVVAIAQLAGASGRVIIGSISDRAGSRVRVVRWVAICCVVLLLGVAALGVVKWPIAAALVYIAATTISVADNGLTFTSVAEAAGAAWSGRVFGIHNSVQYIAAFGVGPVVGALITAVGYPLSFALVAAAPVLSVGLTPAADKDVHG